MLERLRDRNTGEYPPRNSSIIQRLEEEFADSYSTTYTYWVKLTLQGILYLIYLGITFGAFRDFNADVICPHELEDPHIEFGRVRCVYGRFRLLNILRYTNSALLIVGFIIVVVGALTLMLSKFVHTQALNHETVAKFSYHSALHPSYYYKSKQYSFSLRSSDMDFMLLKLYTADAGYAHILRDIQVSDCISQLLESDYQKLYLFDTLKEQGIL